MNEEQNIEIQKSEECEKELKGTEGLLIKILFTLTIVGIPLASVILMYWAINQ